MSYWLREIAGWALILIGLVAFFEAYNLLLRKRIFEAGPLVFVGFIVFRGGVHLLKVAVAAQAARRLPETAAPAVKRPRPVARPVGPTAATTVLPGPQNAPRRQGAGAAGRGRE